MSNAAKEKRPSVLVIHHYFADYRLSILQSMFGSENVDYFFCGDRVGSDGVKTIDVDRNNLHTRFLDSKYISIGPRKVGLFFQKGLLGIVHKGQYNEVVILGSIFILSNWLLLVYCRGRGIKISVWTHGLLGKESKFVKFVRFLMFLTADTLILYGERAEKLLREYSLLFSRKQMVVINNSLSDEFGIQEKLNAARGCCSPENLKTKSVCLFCVGRLTKVKRLDIFIEAVGELLNLGVPVKALIIGDGPERSKLVDLSRELGIAQAVDFTGAVYGPDANRLIMGADICVVPGNAGLTVMHALELGKPVVTHDLLDVQMPEVEAIIEGVTGSFYKFGSLEDLVSKLDMWIQKVKTDRSEIISDCGTILMEKYNSTFQVKQLDNLFCGRRAD